ncbi:MAG: hypothetical protein DRO88_04060 [Promethearchaeia archaeon]|nr:MAG: hypothetical protein DRO88_04060 [Candidatus Lokiarchaeia archaeon]
MDQMERIVFTNLETQSKYISQTFKEMGLCINSFFADREKIHDSIAKIRNFEKEANKLRRKNLEIIAQAVSIYRSDFFRLVMKMADVMGNQAGASVRLGNIKYVPKKDDSMIPKFQALISAFVEMGERLRDLMKILGDDLSKAPNYCNAIDEVEEKVDELYRDLHGHLYNRMDIPLRYIMQFLSVAKHIEEACDHCASVADSVRIILSTH